MSTIDTSRIDRMELRREILALDEKRKALQAEADAEEGPMTDEIEQLRQAYVRERNEAERAYAQRCADVVHRYTGGTTPAKDRLDEHDAAEAYREVNEWDEDGSARCCVLTGLPILDDDVTVEDGDGRRALAAAIPGWPLSDDADGDSADAEPAAIGGETEGAEDGGERAA